VPRCDPHDTSVLMQPANDTPAEETGSAENGDNAWAHRAPKATPLPSHSGRNWFVDVLHRART
jgi:hypothetical protein